MPSLPDYSTGALEHRHGEVRRIPLLSTRLNTAPSGPARDLLSWAGQDSVAPRTGTQETLQAMVGKEMP